MAGVSIESEKSYSFWHYVFIYAILQVTCVPFWSGYRVLLAFLVLVSYFFYHRKNGEIKFDNKIGIIFLIYSFLVLIQGIIWDFSPLSLFSSFAFSFLFLYLLYHTYRFDFLLLFESVFFVSTIISTVIWGIQNLFPNIVEVINLIINTLHPFSSDEWPRSMLIYTYWDDLSNYSYMFSRNAGFLHEPGAFATLITLAIVINYIRGMSLFCKRNIIYIIAIISTISTAGYISLFVLLMLLIKQKKHRILSLVVLPLLFAGAIYSYNNFDFMSNKIEAQFDAQMATRLDVGGGGRIVGARKSIEVLLNHPFYGRGLNTISKPEYDSPEFAGYGWISYISQLGLIFGSLFLIFFFAGIYRFVKLGGFGWFEFLIVTLSIMINLSSQSYIAKPFFFFFFFAGLYYLLNGTKKRINHFA